MPGIVMHGICKYTLTNLLCNCTMICYNKVWHQQLADWLWRTSTSAPALPLQQFFLNQLSLLAHHPRGCKFCPCKTDLKTSKMGQKCNPYICKNQPIDLKKKKKKSALKLTCHLNFYILQKEYGNLEDITRVKLMDSDIWVLPEFPPTKWWLVVV